MKIILDTNVLISGIFFSGPPYQILKLWHENKFQIVITIEIFEEYKKVAEILSEEYPEIDISQFLNYLIKNSEIAPSLRLNERICSDPDDDKFIACAIACDCKIIVSGDKHLLNVSGFQQIEVMKPRDFLERHKDLYK